MRCVGNPLIWLLRLRHRRGYGVHSPFAYGLIADVLYERLPYYAFAHLDKALPLSWRLRRKKMLHLLFRLANMHQPQAVQISPDEELQWQYISAACPSAQRTWGPPLAPKRNMIVLQQPSAQALALIHPGTLLVMDNLQCHRQWFEQLPSVVSFDLYDMGIAFFDPQYNKQHYIVNF